MNRRTSATAACVIALLCLARTGAGGPETKPARRDVSPVLKQLVEKYKVPGMVAAVIE